MEHQQKAYSPPGPKAIMTRQNSISALRLLIAQRKFYSKSKVWLGARLIGMGLISIIAPITALAYPNYSVVVGAIAALWLIAGRTTLLTFNKNLAAKGAATQELFDIEVFEMPELGNRTPTPSLEEITLLSGTDEEIESTAKAEELIDWYPINIDDTGLTSVAICQRANATYSRDLLKTVSVMWMGILVLWAIILIAASLWLNISFSQFLLGIMLPLLPAFYDIWDYRKVLDTATLARGSLIKEIEEKLRSKEITGEDLVVWQTRMYELRREVPQVPDIIYWAVRPINEKVMHSVAEQLSDKSRAS